MFVDIYEFRDRLNEVINNNDHYLKDIRFVNNGVAFGLKELFYKNGKVYVICADSGEVN